MSSDIYFNVVSWYVLSWKTGFKNREIIWMQTKFSQQIDKMQLSLLTIFQVLAFSFEDGIDYLHDYPSGT